MLNKSANNFYQIIKKIQQKFQNKQNLIKIFQNFQEEIKQIFKLQITFDSNVYPALIKRLDVQFQLYYYDKIFLKTLNFCKDFKDVLIQKKFISKRIQKDLRQKINSFQKDQEFIFYGHLDYIRKAKYLKEFRQDFFYRYCKIDLDDLQSQDWDQQDFKQKYTQFWLKFLQKNPNKKLVVFIYSCFRQHENVDQMLTNQAKNLIDKFIGQQIGKTDIQIQINKQLKLIAINNIFQNFKQTKQKINKEYELIFDLLNKLAGSKKCRQMQLTMHLSKFGSLISGFAGGDADLDVTILTNCYVQQTKFLHYVHQFLKIQFTQQDKKTGKSSKVLLIQGKIPLVQVTIKDDRRSQELKIDIVVNNILGVINSKFLNVYSSISWIKQLGILVKLWAKNRGLIEKQLLSSYAIIIMLIHFLIQKKYVNIIYNARNRNKNTCPHFMYKRLKQDQYQIFPVYYEFNTNLQNITSYKNVSLLKIFQQFMLFYSQNGQHWTLNQGKNIISVDGTYDKQFDLNCTFTIKDPFDQPHNPGRAKLANKQFFQRRFSDTYQQLSKLQQHKNNQSRINALNEIFQKGR